MKKQNEKVRDAAKAAGVTLWRIAIELGVSEPTLIRWLRLPLPEDKERRINEAIAAIAEEERS